MIHVSRIEYSADASEAGRQIAQLLHVLALAGQIAGKAVSSPADALGEAARIATAYEEAPLVARRRFDSLAQETAAWASAGVNALIGASGRQHRPCPGASRLAGELARAIGKLERIVAP